MEVESTVGVAWGSKMMLTRRGESGHTTPDADSQAPHANGASGELGTNQSSPDIDETPLDDLRQKLRAKLMMATFGEIVSLMMRSPAHKHYGLADLEWLAIPPLLNNQFHLAEARLKDGKGSVPVGGAFWTRVSPEVDAKLSADPNSALRLHPSQWKSGDLYWLIAIFGDKRVANGLIARLRETVFGDQPFKLIGVGEDGRRQAAAIRPSDDHIAEAGK